MPSCRHAAPFVLALACACSHVDEGTPADGGLTSPPTGAPRDAGALTSTDDASSAPVRDGGAPAACAKADVTISRAIPTVWLLVDGSGSMGDGFTGFGTPSRWSVLRQALLDPSSGLVAKLARSVSFGLIAYDGGLSAPGIYVPGLCPREVVVEPAVDNLAAITAAYPQGPMGASTPTHYALEDLARRIREAGPSAAGPTYVLLATDGKPNLCDFHDGIPATFLTEDEAVRTVAEMASQGTKLFAISMAGGDAALQMHLDQVAKAGATGEAAFSPTSEGALVDALSRTIGGAVSCDVQVEGKIVPGRECAGDVQLNGKSLLCNAPDGYRVESDHTTLRLAGAACTTLQTSAQAELRAAFACDDILR